MVIEELKCAAHFLEQLEKAMVDYGVSIDDMSVRLGDKHYIVRQKLDSGDGEWFLTFEECR